MNTTCRHCGKETEEGEIYCPPCLDSFGADKPRKFWFFAVFFSLVLLFLAGMLLWHGSFAIRDISWDDITGKPAATINGEAVSRGYLRTRFHTAKRIIERQYGEDIFTGKMGKNRLVSLKREVLDRILEERLIAQEARRRGLTITDEMVEQELRRIGSEIYGSVENLQKMLGDDGINRDTLKNHIRNSLTYQALAKTKIAQADKGVEPQVSIDSWLGQVKKVAQVVVYDSSAMVANASGGSCGCCGSGGTSGCGTNNPPAPVDAETEKKAAEAAIAAFSKINGNTKGLKARVSDYGCHIQVDIDLDGKTVKSYSYKDEQVFEI